jgi:hypothetical protein
MPKRNRDAGTSFQLRHGVRYWAARCHSCGSPIPIGMASPEAQSPTSTGEPNIGLQIACVNGACLKEDTYGLREIVPFLWPEWTEAGSHRSVQPQPASKGDSYRPVPDLTAGRSRNALVSVPARPVSAESSGLRRVFSRRRPIRPGGPAGPVPIPVPS